MPVAAEPASPHSPQNPRLVALEKANHVRRARAELKCRVARGERDVAEILLNLPAEAHTMTIAELLRCQRNWGHARVLKALHNLSVPESKQLRRLTHRQIKLLLAILRPHDLANLPAGTPEPGCAKLRDDPRHRRAAHRAAAAIAIALLGPQAGPRPGCLRADG